MYKSDGIEMVKRFKTEEDAKKLAELVSDFVNNMSCNIKEFVEAMSEQDSELKNQFTDICLCWIKKLNYFSEKKWFDLRNQYSVETANSLNKILKVEVDAVAPDYKGSMDEYNFRNEMGKGVQFETLFTERLGNTHRTLQQTFSSIVFMWLYKMEDFEVSDNYKLISSKVQSNFDEYIWNTPFI